MFSFLRRSGMRHPSGAILRALEADSLAPGIDVSGLGVVETSGRYAGRKVRFFRVFEPQRAADRAVNVFAKHTYDDLSNHLDLVLWAGFVEPNGEVVILARPVLPSVTSPSRQAADRAVHADYERVVFPNGDSPPTREETHS